MYKKIAFHHPFTAILAGPSGCGKTELLMKLLEKRRNMIEPYPKRIVYCYSEWQKKFEGYKDKFEFCQGIFDIDNFEPSEQNLLILDDLLDETQNDKSIFHLFTRGSHYRNISVFLLSQNVFNKGKYSRKINLNSHYLILFNNPRDKSQIQYLAREMYPTNSKYQVESFLDATVIFLVIYLFVMLKNVLKLYVFKQILLKRLLLFMFPNKIDIGHGYNTMNTKKIVYFFILKTHDYKIII